MRIGFICLLLICSSAVSAESEVRQQTLAWPDGTRYVGGVLSGQLQGQGTIYWQDGTRYVGGFKANLRHGPGMLILPNGTTLEGDFIDGQLIDEASDGDPRLEEKTSPLEPQALSAADIADIKNVLDLWAAAWMAQNVEQYLSLYSPDFARAPGESRALWEMNRRERLTTPSYIQVDLIYNAFTRISATEVNVKLRQPYRSDRYREISNKTLALTNALGNWQIIGEQQQ